MNLHEQAIKLLLQIPRGQVTTYKALAMALGNPRAARAIGTAMKQNTQPNIYPCYKVVKSDGHLGGYSSKRGVDEKIERLKKDGVAVKNGKIVDFKNITFTHFSPARQQ